MGNCEDQLRIIDDFKRIVSATWSSPKSEEFNDCLLFVHDLSVWIECLKDIPQVVLFKSSLDECAAANLFCSLGLYKQAMISLRLCLEHCLHGIQLSANDFRFRKWKAGQADMQWASITNTEDGIFSKIFIRSYAPEFEIRSVELISIATTVYRECSEYVHGNFSKLNTLPEQSEFNQGLFSKYVSSFQSMAYLLTLALIIRFKEYIIQNDLLQTLEQPIMSRVSTLSEVQAIYNK